MRTRTPHRMQLRLVITYPGERTIPVRTRAIVRVDGAVVAEPMQVRRVRSIACHRVPPNVQQKIYLRASATMRKRHHFSNSRISRATQRSSTPNFTRSTSRSRHLQSVPMAPPQTKYLTRTHLIPTPVINNTSSLNLRPAWSPHRTTPRRRHPASARGHSHPSILRRHRHRHGTRKQKPRRTPKALHTHPRVARCLAPSLLCGTAGRAQC